MKRAGVFAGHGLTFPGRVADAAAFAPAAATLAAAVAAAARTQA
jgi:hypothetical protein